MDLLSGRSGADRDATARVRAWVRELVGADADATVVVSELTCGDPDCPDLETVIAVAFPGEEPLKVKFPKPARDVRRAELVPLLRP